MQTGFNEEIFYDEGGEAQEQVVLPRWWMHGNIQGGSMETDKVRSDRALNNLI